jgi:hypothetical protein
MNFYSNKPDSTNDGVIEPLEPITSQALVLNRFEGGDYKINDHFNSDHQSREKLLDPTNLYARIPDPTYHDEEGRVISIPLARLKLLRWAKCCFFLLFVEFSMIVSALVLPWIDYCYFTFGLVMERKSVHVDIPKGSGTNSIDHFYSEVCEPDLDYFSLCPNFCSSIKKVKEFSKLMFGLGIISGFFSLFPIFFICIKSKVKSFRCRRWIAYISLFMSIASYVIGFAFYCKMISFDSTKKDKNSKNDDPNDYGWNTAMGLNMWIFIIQFFKLIGIRNLVRVFYS